MAESTTCPIKQTEKGSFGLFSYGSKTWPVGWLETLAWVNVCPVMAWWPLQSASPPLVKAAKADFCLFLDHDEKRRMSSVGSAAVSAALLCREVTGETSCSPVSTNPADEVRLPRRSCPGLKAWVTSGVKGDDQVRINVIEHEVNGLLQASPKPSVLNGGEPDKTGAELKGNHIFYTIPHFYTTNFERTSKNQWSFPHMTNVLPNMFESDSTVLLITVAFTGDYEESTKSRTRKKSNPKEL